MYHTDFLILGAGIIGLTLARELIQQGVERVLVIEKEPSLGWHASGRNSGVLHAGVYYPAHTLKAQLCLQGNLLLQEYCTENNLPLARTGKVIVARDAAELPRLYELQQRATANGAKVEIVDEQQLEDIEPHAKTFEKALYSHHTAVVDNHSILQSLYKTLVASKKVQFLFNTPFLSMCNESTVRTAKGDIHFKELINCAGAYADKIAHSFAVGLEYYLIPFKGIYHKLIPEQAHVVRGNIYPVPDLGNPFLGVHFTKNIHGEAYVGPTAIPAFGRENYGAIQGMNREMWKILFYEALLFFTNPAFRQVALQEPKKYFAKYFFADAKRLVKKLKPEWLVPATKVGIRPQLINIRSKQLIMDFVVLQEKNTLHVLNAISPAFTSSMAFAKYMMKFWGKK